VEFVVFEADIAFGALDFTLGVRYLKVIDHPPLESEEIEEAIPSDVNVAVATE
jgi:hypothetical protein